MSSVWACHGGNLPWLLLQLVHEKGRRLSLEVEIIIIFNLSNVVNEHNELAPHSSTQCLGVVSGRLLFFSSALHARWLLLRSDLRKILRCEIYFQVTQSFLPRVARPTPSSSSEAKLLSSTESSRTGSSKVAKSDGKRSKAKWILPKIQPARAFWPLPQERWSLKDNYWDLPPHPIHLLIYLFQIAAMKPSICDNIVLLDLAVWNILLFFS